MQEDPNKITYFASTNSPNLGSALSYIPETTWNTSSLARGLSASGGGTSILFSKPVWQNGPGVPNDNARDVPDISLNANSTNIGYLTISQGTLHSSGGTSASTPAMAGIVALLNHYQVSHGFQSQPGLGNINRQLYRLAQAAPSVFHDVTTGNNAVPCVQGSPGCSTGAIGYAAGVGYDLATGLGSIDANNFVTQWNVPTAPVSVALQPGAASVALSDTVSVKASVKAASGAAIPTGTVDLSTNGTTLGSAKLGSDATATISFPAYLAGIGNATIFGEYSGDSSFSSGGASATVKVNPAGGGSAVLFTAPAVAVMRGTNSGVPYWQFTITLAETEGVATTISGFSIDGQAQDVTQLFPNPGIPAGATLTPQLTLTTSSITPPSTHLLTISGMDAGGATWSRQSSVAFEPLAQSSSAEISTFGGAQDPSADPSCPWSIPLFLDEAGGIAMLISDLTIDGVSQPGQVIAKFGTTRLYAWGTLQSSVCFTGINPGDQHSIGINRGGNHTSSSTVIFSGAPDLPNPITVSPTSLTLTDSGTATLSINPADPNPRWFVATMPRNRTGSWLKTSAVSGTASGQIQVGAFGDGFEPGVYRGTVVISSDGPVVTVPVMFVHGPNTVGVKIDAVVNSFSYQPVGSAGMLLSIFGSRLANSVQDLSASPQISAGGVSVTVNGITAPILYLSPTLINVQIPYTAGSGPAVIGVNNNGQVAGLRFQMAASAPGIFADSKGNAAPSETVAPGGTATIYVTGAGDVSPAFPSIFAAPPGTVLSSPQTPILPAAVTVGGAPASKIGATVIGPAWCKSRSPSPCRPRQGCSRWSRPSEVSPARR